MVDAPVTVDADAPGWDETDLGWMRRALELAGRAERDDDEIPVGAVLVDA